MASYHCTVKVGGKGRAGKHSDYIEREGEYLDKASGLEDLEHKYSGNMPAWAEHEVGKFWRAADEHERANGATYREIEVALPRELNPEQRRALVDDFIAQEIGDRHAFTYAIHIPKAALEKGDQPHAHIMYSERTVDGIDRDPEQYFKRYNAKAPEKGGCKKDSAGTKERLLATRELFANIQNKHLEMSGSDARVSHLSLKARGIDRKPEKHIGPVQVKALPGFDVSALLARRAAEGELERSRAELSTIDISGDLAAALKDRNDERTAIFRSIDEAGQRTRASAEASDRASIGTAADHRSIAGNVQAATVISAAPEFDLGRTTEALGRRIAERDYGRALEATRPELGHVNQVLQQFSGNSKRLEVIFADAASAVIQQQIEAVRVLKALEAIKPAKVRQPYQSQPDTERPVRLTTAQRVEQYAAERKAARLAAVALKQPQEAAKPETKATAPAVQEKPLTEAPKAERDMSHQVHLTKADAKALVETAMLLKGAQKCDTKAINDLAEHLETLAELHESATRAGAVHHRPFSEGEAARQASRENEITAQREVNKQAAERGIKAIPCPMGGERYDQTYAWQLQEANSALSDHKKWPRPDGWFKGKEIAAYDAKTTELTQKAAGWGREVQWSKDTLELKIQAGQPAEHEHIERLRQYDAKTKADDLARTAPARARADALAKDTGWLKSEIAKLPQEALKQLRAAVERRQDNEMDLGR